MPKHKWSSQVPSLDDLKGWKETDGRLAERFAEYLQFEDRPWSTRSIKRYFNDDNLEYFLKRHKERAVVQADGGTGRYWELNHSSFTLKGSNES